MREEKESVLLLRERIEQFVRFASIEITPSNEALLDGLTKLLPPRATVYVSHVPKATLRLVVQTALAVQAAGLTASPHIVARRLESPHTLSGALAELRSGGVNQILLVGGDMAHLAGGFGDSLNVLRSGIIEPPVSLASAWQGIQKASNPSAPCFSGRHLR